MASSSSLRTALTARNSVLRTLGRPSGIIRAGPSSTMIGVPLHTRSVHSSIPLSSISLSNRHRATQDLTSNIYPMTPSFLRQLSTSSRTLNAPSISTTPISQPSPNPASSTTSSNPPPPEPEPQGAYAKFKALSKKYGWYAVIMYFLLSTVDFSLSFLLVHSIGAEHIEPILQSGIQQYRVMRYGEETAAELLKEDKEKKERELEEEKREIKELGKKGGSGNGKSGWGSRAIWAEVALAYAIHKTALLPFRAGLTVAWTPKVVAWLTRRGWVGKGGVTRAATHAQGKMKNASDRVKDIASRARSQGSN